MYSNNHNYNESYTKEYLEKLFNHFVETGRLFVAETEDNDIIGFIVVKLIANHPSLKRFSQWDNLKDMVCDEDWYLRDFGVMPSFQGKGIGTTLLYRAKDHIIESDGTEKKLLLMTSSDESNRSISYYQKHSLNKLSFGEKNSVYMIGNVKDI